jgi:hypothetical protein
VHPQAPRAHLTGTQLKKGLSTTLADTDSGINHNPASCADSHRLCFIYSTPAVFVVVNNGFCHRYDITPLHYTKSNKTITPNKTANKTAPFNHNISGWNIKQQVRKK